MAMPEWVKKELRDNFANASRAGRRAVRTEPRAATAAYRARDEALHVKLTNGAAFTIPVKLIPALARAAARDIGTVEVLGRGGGPKERPQGRPATGAGGSRPSLGPDGRRGDYISCERRSSPTSRPPIVGTRRPRSASRTYTDSSISATQRSSFISTCRPGARERAQRRNPAAPEAGYRFLPTGGRVSSLVTSSRRTRTVPGTELNW